ncbi:MAG: hypothetical protein H7831_11080 [Magnetococcus sp. WYHC-3]
MSDSQNFIIAYLDRCLRDKGVIPPPLTAHSQFLSGEWAFDSLDLAQLITALEQHSGFDPFAQGFIPFQTIGELAELFDRRP